MEKEVEKLQAKLKSKCYRVFSRVTKKKHQAPRLFKLVKVNDDKYLSALYYALRDTLVTEDLDEASAIVYQGHRYKYRVVTLDGQLVEMSGEMSGGGEKLRMEQDVAKNHEANY